MATVAMGLSQFWIILSCELGTGLHTCDLGIDSTGSISPTAWKAIDSEL